MHGDEIRLAINIVHFRRELRADGLRAVFREIRIVGDHTHAEGDGALGHFRADAAHAEHAERLALQFDTLKKFPVPLAADHRRVRLRHLARQRKQHGEGQFRRRHRVAAGCVHHNHAVLRAGFDVYVIHADAGATDDAQLLRRLDDLLGHLGLGTHDERGRIRHEREQFRLGQPFREDHDVKFGPLLEQRDALGRDGVTDDDFHKFQKWTGSLGCRAVWVKQ